MSETCQLPVVFALSSPTAKPLNKTFRPGPGRPI